MKTTNILLTGPPGCGKSTIIQRLINGFGGPTTGFFTREIRERGERIGFSIETLDGKTGVLAHVNVESHIRVGKYRVNLHDLENIAVPSIIPSTPDEVIVIDEIGKMECFSAQFRQRVLEALSSPNLLIGSIALRGERFIQQIKQRSDLELILVTGENRNALIETLANRLLIS